MGNSLSCPETEKTSDVGEGLGLRYGLSNMQGWRSEMEDAHVAKLGLGYGLDDWSFFAVFDGHAGKRSAGFASWNLLNFILRDSQFRLGAEEITESMYVDLDNDVNATSKQQQNVDSSNKNDNSQKDENKLNLQPNQTEGETSDTHSETKQKQQTRPETSSSYLQPKDTQSTTDSEKPKENLLNHTTTKPEPSPFSTMPVAQQLELVRLAIKSGFLKIDESMRSSIKDLSGCTAVCSFITPTHILIANCGDSRAVISNKSGIKFATLDHKPASPTERHRIHAAGGVVTDRINGTLAVSRALGDFEFKKDCKRGPTEQLVSPEPEVTVLERDSDDEFLILACDGIWDVMDNPSLRQFVKHQLQTESNLEKICSNVLDLCLHKGSRDNMTIIIVVLNQDLTVDPSEVAKAKANDEILLQVADSVFKKNTFVDFRTFLSCVENELFDTGEYETILPPGGGIEAKHDMLNQRFDFDKIEREKILDNDNEFEV